MNPQAGYDYANWERGFGDFHMDCDMNSLRLISWQDKTALVMCDIKNDKTHELVPVAPRSVLRKQIDRVGELQYNVSAATELEYYMFENSYRECFANKYQQSLLQPVGDYYEDYHILQTAREEKYTKEFRAHLKASGIPVENSKGECGIGKSEAFDRTILKRVIKYYTNPHCFNFFGLFY
jgi:glutamine synthetase